ncbi:endolytic transglycosylase MltG [Nocardioides jishulii]|uniref:Endolytic murein transglycosylase n=1 Tax=Nocardioides jishulii TaxID=2575440 RepID=A0A4U2YN42_9ACTN|nr:endolytic transglycosylase MltG [Nocardioides jishulii]QCX27448.1 endolytic transglycosylase MltG [Nocardioides jishulii]TKI62254.1 endolytic transglycosylase MltG [Nocardioides jishulii]
MLDDEGTTQTSERSYAPEGGARKAKKRRNPLGIVAVVVVVALVCVGLYVGVSKGVNWVQDQFGSAEDFSGPGTGEVIFEVREGDTSAAIGRGLKEAGVIASVEAFISAATADTRSSKIQVGYYPLRKEMSAVDALEVLVDPANQVKNTVTVPEGLRVVDIVDILAEKTEFSRAQYEAALKDTAALGLPDFAEGNPEGYLFPATYDIGPKDKPKDILAKMVARWRQAADDVQLESRAAALGYTPAELMTVASLVEAEGRGDDMAKIATVIYNRVENPGAGTGGKLQIDATVNYALGRTGTIAVTTDETLTDHPYNTYVVQGLPPGPIEAPGEEAMAAAGNPAEGPWIYYVTVDLKTGETKFTDSYDEFLTFKAEYKSYCTTSDAC